MPVSRSKRARARERKRAATRQARPSLTPPSAAFVDAGLTRLGSARRRAQTAKLGIGAVALVCVGAGMGLSRVTYAGHAKRPARALSIPQPLYRVVRQNLLQAGILAPATAPPDVATSTS